MKRIIRTEHLTPEEAARYNAMRKQIEADYPPMPPPEERLYIGILQSRIVYGERVFGDDGRVSSLDRLATLSYATLELVEEKPIPEELRPLVDAHVAEMKAAHGQRFSVNSNDTSYVTLGGAVTE
jgi:hypothetical protein